MFKTFFAPIQARLLQQNLCPACTRKLDKQKTREPMTTELEMITCDCGRMYIHNRPHKRYRRALEDEVRKVYPLYRR